jgi:integrase
MPRSVEALRTLAVEYGVCLRPVALRRTDLTTGETEVIDLPCGATREDKCPSCAKRARRLRQQQCREGWHRDDEPLPEPDDPTEGQRALIVLRAHFEFERNRAIAAARWDQVTDLDEAIAEVETAITESGMRGAVAPAHPTRDETGVPNGGADEPTGKRRVRSTKRRQDTPDLPRKKVQPRTLGRTYETDDGKAYRPSMFVTLTLDSYGRVRDDGTPVDPAGYDYRRAAWDAVHFPALLDRFWQNLRRAIGWNVQYFGALEPQRRLAPHAHFAIRGSIERSLLRQVAAATYHQVWWPAVDQVAYHGDRLPEWDEQARTYVDPGTRAPLPTWDEALDQVDADDQAEPVHVARFGEQLDIKGVLGGTPEADKLIGYLTKYLTKSVDACHVPDTDRQLAHLERFWSELRYTPCSPRCANWLRYGVQPKKARPGQRPGHCKARVHQRPTLGMGGRGSSCPGSGPARPSPTTRPTPAPGYAPCSACPPSTPTTRPATTRRAPRPRSRGRWPTRTTPTCTRSRTGSSPPSPRASSNAPNSTQRESEQRPDHQEMFRQPHRTTRIRTGRRSALGRRIDDQRGSCRSTARNTPVRAATRGRAAHRVREGRPFSPVHPIRCGRLHRAQPGRGHKPRRDPPVPEGGGLMANKKNHRRFGNVRKLPSGRWQARYVGPDGIERKAPTTFETERQGENWLTLVESEIIRGEWTAPDASEVKLDDYGQKWIAERRLEPRTRENYEDLFRINIRPYLGMLTLGSIKPATIRSWRKRLLDDDRPEPQAVKAYCLLRAILNTARREDKIIRENPCQIKGYDRYHTPERRTATVAQVYALASQMPLRFAALVIVAAFSGLRWGELAALRRCDVDLKAGTVRVPRKLAALRNRLEFGPPKSDAGTRTVALPEAALAALRPHMLTYVGAAPEAIVFTGDKGGLLRTGNFRRAVKWAKSVKAAGIVGEFHFHDLRHTGNTLASASGASTRELMHRMGHSSMRAALIYQHSTDERQREIADGMDRRIAGQTGKKPRKSKRKKNGDDGDDGTAGNLARVG